MASSYTAPPSGRMYPFTASAGNLKYLWGGEGDTEPGTVRIFRRDTETWTRQLTRGPHPPAGLRSGGCCLSGPHLYLYGGYDGIARHGVLYELNTDTYDEVYWRTNEVHSFNLTTSKRQWDCVAVYQ